MIPQSRNFLLSSLGNENSTSPSTLVSSTSGLEYVPAFFLFQGHFLPILQKTKRNDREVVFAYLIEALRF